MSALGQKATFRSCLRSLLYPRSGHRTVCVHTLIRKPEMHDVAVHDDIVLAFEPELAGIARAGFAVERDIVGIGDGPDADEPAFVKQVPIGAADSRVRPRTDKLSRTRRL